MAAGVGRDRGPGVPAGGGGTLQPLHRRPHRNREEGDLIGLAPRADRYPRARLEEASDARRGGLRVRLEDDSPARDGGVKTRVRKIEAGGIGLHELDVAQAGRRRAFTPEREHLGGDVGGHDPALRAGLARGGERRLAIAGRHVQDPASRLHSGELHQPLADVPVGAVIERAPLLPSHRSRVPVLVLRLAEADRVDVLG